MRRICVYALLTCCQLAAVPKRNVRINMDILKGDDYGTWLLAATVGTFKPWLETSSDVTLHESLTVMMLRCEDGEGCFSVEVRDDVSRATYCLTGKMSGKTARAADSFIRDLERQLKDLAPSKSQ